MDESEKFLRMFGGIFLAVGLFVMAIGVGMVIFVPVLFAGMIPLLIGFVFTCIGGGIVISQMKSAAKRKNVAKNGVKYTGKIYGYLEDKSFTMNNDYLINIKVHYFDQRGVEREGVIPTRFTRGSGEFPIGATIDIIVLGTEYTWVPGSVRYERIYREEELMDDKPMDPQAINMVAVTCNHCGASFTTAKGYAARCPYCGSSIDC